MSSARQDGIGAEGKMAHQECNIVIIERKIVMVLWFLRWQRTSPFSVKIID